MAAVYPKLVCLNVQMPPSETFEPHPEPDKIESDAQDWEFVAWREWRNKWSTRIKVKIAKIVKYFLEH